MPKRAPTPCREIGCAGLSYEKAHEGYCEAHLGTRDANKARYRATALRRRQARPEQVALDAFYGTAAWKRTRRAHIALEPLCRHCGQQGIIKAGEVVDHIIERKDGGADHAHDNLQTLCNGCHGIKTRAELLRRREQ